MANMVHRNRVGFRRDFKLRTIQNSKALCNSYAQMLHCSIIAASCLKFQCCWWDWFFFGHKGWFDGSMILCTTLHSSNSHQFESQPIPREKDWLELLVESLSHVICEIGLFMVTKSLHKRGQGDTFKILWWCIGVTGWALWWHRRTSCNISHCQLHKECCSSKRLCSRFSSSIFQWILRWLLNTKQ